MQGPSAETSRETAGLAWIPGAPSLLCKHADLHRRITALRRSSRTVIDSWLLGLQIPTTHPERTLMTLHTEIAASAIADFEAHLLGELIRTRTR